MSLRRLVFACGALAALALPAAAAAVPVELETRSTGAASQPQIAGSSVVYQTYTNNLSTRIRLLSPTGSDRVLRQIGPAPEDDDDANYGRSVFFEASAGVL